MAHLRITRWYDENVRPKDQNCYKCFSQVSSSRFFKVFLLVGWHHFKYFMLNSLFFSNTESVRDVQFNPHFHAVFASVSENGNVQTWDMRKPDKCILQFTAHSGPIFACDWHPESHWLATASRDKTIKVKFLCPLYGSAQ